jgi:hypothetical protein
MSAFLKNLPVKGLGGRCLRPPPLLGFVWGGKAIFLGSESGQIYSGLLHTTLSPPPPVTYFIECIDLYLWYSHREGRGGEVNWRDHQ